MTAENQILAILSPDVLQQLEPHLTSVTLNQGDVVYRPGEPLSYIYFPIDCLFSIIVTMSDGSTAEVGIVGNRDMLGINAFMGNIVITQTQYLVQIAGSAKRIDAQIVRTEFERNEELREVLLRYTQAFLVQVSQTAACNSLHVLEQRLARWLLGTRERINSNTIPLTQEFIAIMLGVRRAGVTLAAQKLQERKLIQYRRGNVQILNQVGLEAFACECFKTIQAEYDRLLGERLENQS
ncbi:MULTISPECIES: Crp/Fnr family transcriptional regulator [unclassified Leptolyngbya]|uniref:Crp/Fnr family transcriptional regulator n=1 Tax=unclassified Leptolyngbya TaxID=2650499 RepID=UPI001685693F|nr:MULTISPECIES: Crp/Fnr family transcriptional regulator [unclassified Leptolyngbya]MBD1909315.1 Crp/Fnr family transcriptional regulator [Leptolyngbya sp. FACHB-8]MBD2153545.1 Crp/Fnr family transcriptional regulator [Leptolyngbya sp. FACHB-16]